MTNRVIFFPLVLTILIITASCSPLVSPSPAPTPTPAAPDIRIHYLGHSAFLLFFDNGASILTDYGQSRAYGLDSPIYDLGDFQPTIVLYSHHHADHDRGATFADAKVLSGEDWSGNQIDIRAVRVSENSTGDNFGYRISYKGFLIFHAGDSQGDMFKLAIDAEVPKRLRSQLSEKIDLLLAPIDWTMNIIPQAAGYIDLLQPRRVIPMHYWSPSIKSEFLDYLRTSGKNYQITQVGGSEYEVFISQPAPSAIEVISLEPAAYAS